jgi:NAD(P)-dependent dehydrogenase (short-subunit alcohol dehydrogenase family)
VRTLLLDVNDEAADAAFAEQAIAQFGQVDALVNDAGYYQMGPWRPPPPTRSAVRSRRTSSA